MKSRVLAVSCFLVCLLATSASAEKGYLFIESVPDKAEVKIDGKEHLRFFTPVLCTLSVGEHQVAVSRPYYQMETITIRILPEAVTRRVVRFVRQERTRVEKIEELSVPGKYGQLTILTIPSWAKVIADDKELDITTPLTLSDVPAGKHRYRIFNDNVKYDTIVEISGDNPQTMTINLTALEGIEQYSNVPRVWTKVIIELPGCEYRSIGDDETMLIKGVDPDIRISTGDTSIALTHRQLAEHSDNKTERRVLKHSELTYYFEPYRDSVVRFDISTYANIDRNMLPRDEAASQHKVYSVPASLNSGEEVNVRILIEEDGDIIFRYW